MIKQLRIIWILIFMLCAQKGYSQSTAGTVNTVGGWIEVTPLGNAKYRIDCQLLMSLGGALSIVPNHHKRVRRDTSVELRIYDSAQNYVTITTHLLDGCFYTQKDTANKLMDPNQALWNNHYKNTFRCTVDLNSNYIKSKINVNSSFLEFYCNYTGGVLATYSMVKTFAPIPKDIFLAIPEVTVIPFIFMVAVGSLIVGVMEV
jgi:hypothetical protein